MGDYFSAWRALEDAYEAGKLKAIGVSNFYAHVLANFCETVRITPMVNRSNCIHTLHNPPRWKP